MYTLYVMNNSRNGERNQYNQNYQLDVERKILEDRIRTLEERSKEYTKRLAEESRKQTIWSELRSLWKGKTSKLG